MPQVRAVVELLLWLWARLQRPRRRECFAESQGCCGGAVQRGGRRREEEPLPRRHGGLPAPMVPTCDSLTGEGGKTGDGELAPGARPTHENRADETTQARLQLLPFLHPEAPVAVEENSIERRKWCFDQFSLLPVSYLSVVNKSHH